jgi:O-antigen ligase
MTTRIGPLLESRTLVTITTALLIVTVGRVMDLFPFMYGIPIVKILTVLAVLSFFFAPRVPRPGFQQSHLARIVWALIFLAVVSVAFSAWRSMSLLVLTGSIAAITALLVLIYKTGSSMRSLERYLLALAIAGGALALGGLVYRGDGRLAFGRQYDPNDLAFVLIALLPIVLAFWRVQRGVLRWAWLAIAGASVSVILLTQSRGGLLGLLLVVSYLAAVGAWRTRFQTGFRFGRVLVGWVLLAFLAVGAWVVLPGDAKERYATLLDPQSDYNMTATREGRIAIWQRGLGALAERPWGVGVGAYPMAEMARSGYWRTAHNSVLELSVELGVVGGVLYLLMFWRGWHVLGRVMTAPGQGLPAPPRRIGPLAPAASAASPKWQKDPTVAVKAPRPTPGPTERWRIHSQHLRGTLIGILGTGLFLSQAYALVVYAVIAIVAALEARYLPRPLRVRGMAPTPTIEAAAKAPSARVPTDAAEPAAPPPGLSPAQRIFRT